MFAVSRENTNCSNGMSMCCSTCSNQSRLAAAARWRLLGFRAACGVERRQGVFDRRMRAEQIGQRLGVFQARADIETDREMRGIGGAAERDRVAGMPAPAADRDERLPRAVVGVRHAVELFGKISAAERKHRVRRRLVETVRPDRRRRCFHHHGRAAEIGPDDGVHRAAGRRAESVAQGVALRRRLEGEEQVCAGRRVCRREPDQGARGTIGRDDEVGVAELFGDRVGRALLKLAAGAGCDAFEGIDQRRRARGGIGEPAGLEPALAGADFDAVKRRDLRIQGGEHFGVGKLQAGLERIADDRGGERRCVAAVLEEAHAVGPIRPLEQDA